LGTFDLIVDSSGVSSPLRKFRIEGEEDDGTGQYYNGLTMIGGIIQDPEDTLDPNIVRMLWQGSVEFVGDLGDDWIVQILHAKLQFLFARDRRGQLAEELKLGKEIYVSNISKNEYPDAYENILKFLKASLLRQKWPTAFHDAIDQMEHLQIWDFHQFLFDAKVRPDAIPLFGIGDAL